MSFVDYSSSSKTSMNDIDSLLKDDDDESTTMNNVNVATSSLYFGTVPLPQQATYDSSSSSDDDEDLFDGIDDSSTNDDDDSSAKDSSEKEEETEIVFDSCCGDNDDNDDNDDDDDDASACSTSSGFQTLMKHCRSIIADKSTNLFSAPADDFVSSSLPGDDDDDSQSSSSSSSDEEEDEDLLDFFEKDKDIGVEKKEEEEDMKDTSTPVNTGLFDSSFLPTSHSSFDDDDTLQDDYIFHDEEHNTSSTSLPGLQQEEHHRLSNSEKAHLDELTAELEAVTPSMVDQVLRSPTPPLLQLPTSSSSSPVAAQRAESIQTPETWASYNQERGRELAKQILRDARIKKSGSSDNNSTGSNSTSSSGQNQLMTATTSSSRLELPFAARVPSHSDISSSSHHHKTKKAQWQPLFHKSNPRTSLVEAADDATTPRRKNFLGRAVQSLRRSKKQQHGGAHHDNSDSTSLESSRTSSSEGSDEAAAAPSSSRSSSMKKSSSIRNKIPSIGHYISLQEAQATPHRSNKKKRSPRSQTSRKHLFAPWQQHRDLEQRTSTMDVAKRLNVGDAGLRHLDALRKKKTARVINLKEIILIPQNNDDEQDNNRNITLSPPVEEEKKEEELRPVVMAHPPVVTRVITTGDLNRMIDDNVDDDDEDIPVETVPGATASSTATAAKTPPLVHVAGDVWMPHYASFVLNKVKTFHRFLISDDEATTPTHHVVAENEPWWAGNKK